MSFRWQIPNPPPDAAAIKHMRQHFTLPPDPMPEAWFMSGETNFFTWLCDMTPEALMNDDRLCEVVFREISGGLIAFPNTYVKEWTEWFKYLLPDAIVHSQEHALNNLTINAFIAVYPQRITEEYERFRDEVVYALGTRFIPEELSRDKQPTPNVQNVQNPVFNDIWNETGYEGMEYPGVGDESGLAMFFCLKYLTPSEIESWVESFFTINSPQWYLTVITWWSAFNKFLKLAEDWPQNGELKDYFEETGLIRYMSLTHQSFKTFDDFIPSRNLIVFKAELSRQLTISVFQHWASEIRSHRTLTLDGETWPLDEGMINSLENILHDFENQFFAT